MASPGVSILSAHPDSSIIVFVNVSSKTSSCSTRKQANDIHMVVEIFCRITLNSAVGDKRHPRLFSSQISPPHQSCLPRQRHMEIMRKKFRYERLLMNAVCSSLKNAHLDFFSCLFFRNADMYSAYDSVKMTPCIYDCLSLYRVCMLYLQFLTEILMFKLVY